MRTLTRQLLLLGCTTCLLAVINACTTTDSRPVAANNLTARPFGSVDGQAVTLFTLKNKNGLIAKIMDYGATLVEMHTPDKNGKMDDIVLGFDTLQGYIDDSPYFGSTVGRVANRIANGEFTLNEETYTLAKNDGGKHHLHGGEKGWDKKVWQAIPQDGEEPSVLFKLISPDGDEGYPGEVRARVRYTLTNKNELKIMMTATADESTPINMAHHSYWNLGGHDSGTILDHVLSIPAMGYTVAGPDFIPTGEIRELGGKAALANAAQGIDPVNFAYDHPIREHIDKLPPSGDNPGGYDHNYVLTGRRGVMKVAAEAWDPKSGRVLRIFTTEKGLQFYSGNFLNGHKGKGGAAYEKQEGFCLETQMYPDAINKRDVKGWHDVVIGPGQTYKHEMIHEFDRRD